MSKVGGGLALTYFKMSETLLYIQRNKTDKRPTIAIDLLQASALKPAGGPNFNLEMKDGTVHEFKARNPDEYKKWGKVISDALKHIANTDNKRKIVDVFFMDGSHISVIVNRERTSAEDVRRNVPPFSSCAD